MHPGPIKGMLTRMILRPTFLHLSAPVLAATLALAAGCTPMSEQEKSYLERMEKERDDREEFSKTLGSRDELSDAVKKVKEALHPDGETMETFAKVRESENAQKGNIIWRQWSASLRSQNNYDVKYLYTVLDRKDYQATKHGFSWTYDETLDRVDGPREMTQEELQPRSRKREEATTEKTREADPWSLE